MPLTTIVNSSRFGALEVADEDVLEFPLGLIGLPGSRYALIANDEDGSIVWLHSLEEGALALPVARPERFFSSYKVVLAEGDRRRIGIDSADEADLWVTVRAGAELADFAANLRAPILVVGGQGFQVINEAADAPVRAPLFAEAAAEWAS